MSFLVICHSPSDTLIDRTSPIGKMIDGYLQSKTEMDDHTVHLLFSANRWEKASVSEFVSKRCLTSS